MDARRAAGPRALDLRGAVEPCAHPPLLAMASPRRRRVVSDGSDRARSSALTLRVWLRPGVGIDVSDQSLRSLRSPPSVVVPSRQAVHPIEVWNAGTVSARAASTVRRLVLRVLDDSHDDVCTSALR